jgi:hypothetical protein
MTKFSEKEAEAIIQIANHKLLINNPDHNLHLFDKFYRVWGDGETDGWIVCLEDRDGHVTQPVAVLNSEIESAIKFLDKLECIKRNDPIVSQAFEMSPNSELHALRLAVVGLAECVKILQG